MTNKSRSVIFILLSSLSFALMSVFVKLLPGIPVLEKVFFRNLVSLIVTFFMFRKASGSFKGNPENRKFLILRSLLGLTGVFLYFYAINNLYLADSAMLNKLSPFFVTLFAFLFLSEKIYKQQVVALVVVFLSALLIIKPKFDLSVLPSLSGFLSAICAGAAYTTVRYLGTKGEKPKTIVFYFSLISVLALLPAMFFVFVKPTWLELLSLIAIGVFAAGGQFGLTYAYKYAKASEVSIYNYTNIVFAAILGLSIWKEIPDTMSLIGSVLIIITSIYIFRFNNRKSLSE